MPTFTPARRAAVALLLALAILLPLAPDASASPSTRYTIDARFEFASAALSVGETVHYVNQTGQWLDRLVFRVAPAYFGAFRLLGATVGGQPVDPIRDRTVLEVPLPEALPPGATAKVALDFSIQVPTSPGRLSATDRAVALGNWLPLLTVHRGDWDRRQYVDVGDAFFGEVADFDLTLAADAPFVLAHGGAELESGPERWRVRSRSVRDLALALAPDYHTATLQLGSTSVVAYALDPERAASYASRAAEFLAWFSARFGPYPYPRLAVAEVDLPASYAGMEYPGLIMLAAGLGAEPALPGTFADYVIGHEIAHQWFYSIVGNDQIDDPWLDEAFATYLPLLYYRDLDRALFDQLYADRVTAGYADRVAAAGDGPVDAGVGDFPSEAAYFTIVYRKGARFLAELHETLGDEAFFQLLAEHVAVHRDRIATPRAFLDRAQRLTEANLNPLIGRYFSYGAFTYPEPRAWSLHAPEGAWAGRVALAVEADFPVVGVEFWLDTRLVYSGEDPAAEIDLSDLPPGDYVLLARLYDDQGALFERDWRVTVLPKAGDGPAPAGADGAIERPPLVLSEGGRYQDPAGALVPSFAF